VAGLTLDSGALIAAERGDRKFWALWERAELRDAEITVPANVIAQAYRGPRSVVIARLLQACIVEPVDEHLAKRIGQVCAKAKVDDVVDVSVVVGAAARRDHILTSDPKDMLRIIAHVRGVAGVITI
jgi:predicted nucleic acid-binding protein